MKITFAPKGTIKPIKPFKTLEEEADFWDTHDITEDIDKSKVGFHKAKKTTTLTVRFEPDDIQILQKEALARGIGPTTLVRMWVKEKLKNEQLNHK